jgi:hypothetical protein
MLHHRPVQHARRYIPPTTFLLQGMETLEDDTFSVNETVSDVGEVITRSTMVHQQFPWV